MNLVLMTVAILVLRTFHPGIVGLSFFVMLAFVGLFTALMNGVPMMIGGVSNDGHNLWSLWRHPEERRFFVRTLQIAGALSRGKRMSEMPVQWFEDIPVTVGSHFLEIGNRVTYMTLLEDRTRLDEARQVAEELMNLGNKLPGLFKLEVGGERVMLELLTSNRREVITELWDKQLSRYTEMNSKYSPIKCAVLFAYESLYNNDTAKSAIYKQRLTDHLHDYTMPGEARTALMLVEMIEEKIVHAKLSSNNENKE